MTVCVTCGLPQELCVCESIAKESQKIIVSVERKRFKRNYTLVEGIDDKEINLNQLCKKLKDTLACGGTIKEITVEGKTQKRLELQGDHKQKVKQILIDAGFAPETIIIQ